MTPCTCWVGPVSLHAGHCCMRVAGATCHDAEGKAMYVESQQPREDT